MTTVDANSESTYVVLFRMDWELFVSWRCHAKQEQNIKVLITIIVLESYDNREP
jgi:hypothetical protein